MPEKTRPERREVTTRFNHLPDLPIFRTRVPGGYLVTRVFFVADGDDRDLGERLAEEAKAIAQRDFEASGGGNGNARCN